MFEFLFGGKRKIELIRELLEQRMREIGFDDMSYRLRIKELGNAQLIGTPEGGIVTIVETAIKLQKKGVSLPSIITAIENHRKSAGHSPNAFFEIMQMANKNEFDNSITAYCLYRLEIEDPGKVSMHQCIRAVNQSVQEIESW